MNIPKLLKSLLVGLWRAVDGVRKILHMVFLFAFVGILLAGVSRDQPRLPARAALSIAPEGVLVEQLSGGPLERGLAAAQGLDLGETLLKDLIDAIRGAAEDDRIEALVLDMGGLTGSGLSKLQELADEIVRFKESEKPVIAVGDSFSRNQYYIAAHADEIYMNPMGRHLYRRLWTVSSLLQVRHRHASNRLSRLDRGRVQVVRGADRPRRHVAGGS